jgi:hypothetical protein
MPGSESRPFTFCSDFIQRVKRLRTLRVARLIQQVKSIKNKERRKKILRNPLARAPILGRGAFPLAGSLVKTMRLKGVHLGTYSIGDECPMAGPLREMIKAQDRLNYKSRVTD